MLSRSLIQFSADGWGCVPSLQFGLRPNFDKGNGTLLQKDLCQQATPPGTAAIRLDLTDRVPKEMWVEVGNIMQKMVIQTIPKKKKCKKPMWLPYK